MVLDPFAGTGTTSLVSAQLKRDSIAIEKAPRNIERITERLTNIRDVDRIDRFYDQYQHTQGLSEIWKIKRTSSKNLEEFV